MPDINANINSAECIVSKTNFGSSTFVNICNGNETVVPWAFGDWVAFGTVGILLGALLGMVALVVYFVGFDN
jgi:hypothetical protein